MSSCQSEEKCPKCKDEHGSYEVSSHGYEWFACFKCGYYFSTSLKRVARKEMTALEECIKKCKLWAETKPVVEKLLVEINKYNCYEGKFERAIKQAIEKGGMDKISEVKLKIIVNTLSWCSSLIARDEKGHDIWDTVEDYKAESHLISIPLSEMQPMSGLLDKLADADEGSKKEAN